MSLVNKVLSAALMGELSTYADTDATESCYVNRKYLASVGY